MTENALYQCRLCLKASQFLYSLFDEDVVEIIESFTPIKFDEDDDLPSICCSQCLEDVYLVYKIRTRIIESDKALRQKPATIIKTIKIEENSEENVDAETEAAPSNITSTVIKDDSENDSSSDAEHIEITLNSDEIVEETISKETEKHHECTECKLTFSNYNDYMEHMKKHAILTVCETCGIQVLTCNYKRHIRIHKSNPKICELCGAVAKNTESLRGHMFYMHKSSAQQYHCKQCNKYFRYKYKYKLHIRKQHGGDKSHICEICAKAFYTLGDVKRHIQMTHMKLRPYVCQYCNKGFSSSYARRTHVRQHTNEKPFKCEVCAEGFRQRVSLRTHLKSKHGIVQSTESADHSQKVDSPEMDVVD